MMTRKNITSGLLLAALFLAFLISPIRAQGADYYVDAVNGNNANDGLTPATAWKTITNALSTILTPGNTIHVAQGTYNPGLGETFPLNMRNGVSLVGAGAGSSILDAAGTAGVVRCQNITASTTIDGFTIKNGYTSGDGGGIYCQGCSSSMTIANCDINNNQAYSGGGIASSYYDQSTITNCNISYNNASIGGGIDVYYNSSPTITNCEIRRNSGPPWTMYAYGGGLESEMASLPVLTNCTIVENYAFFGGGMECWSGSAKITNCTISENLGAWTGGGINFINSGQTELVNTILWANETYWQGPDIGVYQDWYFPNTIYIYYSDIDPSRFDMGYASQWIGSNNITANPLFVLPGDNPDPWYNPCSPCVDGDYHLQETSPCIDVGTADSATYPYLPSDDIDSEPRPSGAGYDMGSDEYFVEVENNPPTANAGDDITITEDEVAATTIQGLASDPNAGDVLQYRWLEGAVVLLDWQDVVVEGGLCPLALSGLGLGVGDHTLTLEVTDGEFTASDDMILAIQPVNHPPVANAGDNIQILSEDQAYTVIEGTATDEDGDELEYRWLEGATVLADWSLVGTLGEAYLDLAGVPYFSVGPHDLTLEVQETSTPEQLTASDVMELTINNSPPHVNAQPSSQTVEIGVDPIVVQAQVSDFDGDTVTYEWKKGGDVLASGSVVTVQGGDPVSIPDLYIEAGDSRFPLGDHTIDLVVGDGVNDPVTVTVLVTVQDTTGPSLGPVTCPPVGILWPPNHTLRPVTVCAYAFDNDFSGYVTLDVRVESSEPPDADADGNTIPDIYIDSVNWDPETGGTIELRLRAERQGTGDGRTYTIYITATDASGNSTDASLTVLAPHDKRKK